MSLMGRRLCPKGYSSDSDSDDDQGGIQRPLSVMSKFDDDEDMDWGLIENSNLGKIFADVDEDDSGQMDFSEFLKGFALDNSPLTQKIFYMMDEDHSGHLRNVTVRVP